jgi:hypothetical protein
VAKKRKPIRRSGKSKATNQTAFLSALSQLGNLTAAAEAAKISRQQHYRWLEEDGRDYADRYGAAMQEACDRLESEARRRAVEGVDRPVYQGGKKVGAIREYSDTLLIFLMKGAMPHKYRERVDITKSIPEYDAAIERELARVAGRGQVAVSGPAANGGTGESRNGHH